MVDDSVFAKIMHLRQEINLLLAQRPEYIPFQEEIDRELAKAGDNKHNRLAIIQNLMFTKLQELNASMKDLQQALNKLGKEKI